MSVELTGSSRLPATPGVAGFSIDLPALGTRPGHLVELAGWAVGRNSDVVGIDIRHDGAVVAVAATGIARPDVSAALPEIGARNDCGFRAIVATPGLPEEFRLDVIAHLRASPSVRLGSVTGRRRRLAASPPGDLEPLLVTSLGRTGSTWLLHLTGSHPDIVAFGRWGYELDAMGFFERQFRAAVTHPHGADQPPDFADWRPGSWWGGNNPFDAEDLAAWFRREHVETAARRCHDDVVSFYRTMAAGQGKPGARYFAEKYRPQAAALPLELFGGAREIILVRDFRDMVCSILAFNRKRGSRQFDADLAATDADLPGILAPGVRLMSGAARDRPEALVVRYEDVITQPDATLVRILDHLGLPSDPTIVADTIKAANEPLPQMAAHRTIDDPAESIGRWRDRLDPAVAAACERDFAEALEVFGYAEAR